MRTAHRTRAAAGAAIAAAMLTVAGCAGTPSTPEGDGSALTVWLDAPRLAAGQAYAAENPEMDIRIVTVDKATVIAKINLANQAGSGWPDMVWPGDPATIGLLASEQIDYAADISEFVPDNVRGEFTEGALSGCEIDEGLYCLRNDLGQTVLWYDQKLMDEYGYEIPTTWEEYAELGEKVAEEHPGTIIGTLGGKTGAGTYFVSSECETRNLLSQTEVSIQVDTEQCTRVANLLQPLVENGSVAALDYADPTIAQIAAEDKVLMMPGPSYYGAFAFRDAYKVPEGRITAAPLPAWPGESEPVAGSAGGGILVISSHASPEVQRAATEMALFMTTNVELQKTLPTFPAYAPAAEQWCDVQAEAGYFASDPCPAMTAMAPLVSPTFGSVTYQPEWETTYNATIVTTAGEKGSLLDALDAWGQQLASAAQNQGYTVGTS